MRAILKAVRRRLQRVAHRMFPELFDRRHVKKLYNDRAARAFQAAEVPFLNYGFVPLTEEQRRMLSSVPDQKDLCDQCSVQLYQFVLSPAELQGKEVLEVGCGRGGGCRYIKNERGAGRMVGLDLSTYNLEVCRRDYPDSGVYFQFGDAHDLPFPDRTFDAVVNIESSHCYSHVDCFFQEVYRVLRDDGHFLFADVRLKEEVATLLQYAAGAGFTIIRNVDITANVVESLRLHSKNREEIYWEHCADEDHFKWFAEFARLEGTEAFKRFERGDERYLTLHLRKAGI